MSPVMDRTRSPARPDGSLKQGPEKNSPLLVSVRIRDPRVLQRCYLSFLKRGGLFVPGTRPYKLRQRLFLIVTLPALPGAANGTTHALNVTVAWLTPAQAQDDKGMGVGLHFDAPAGDQSDPDPKHVMESLIKTLK